MVNSHKDVRDEGGKSVEEGFVGTVVSTGGDERSLAGVVRARRILGRGAEVRERSRQEFLRFTEELA